MPDFDCDVDAKPVSFDPIPVDIYPMAVTESDVKDVGGGKQLVVELIVLEGPHAGRKIFDRMWTRHTNAKAASVGQGQIAALRAATGVRNPKASEEFHNIPMKVKVKIKPAGNDSKGIYREAQNEVAAYIAAGQVVPSQPAAPSPAPQPPQQSAPANKLPWQK
jgi:hypothetical protein